MADAANGNARNGGIRITMPMVASAAWALLLAGLGLATNYVYATKDELSEHARIEREKTATIETEAATAKVHVEQHDRDLAELKIDLRAALRTIEAVNQNVSTMMIEQDIPRGRIARPKE